MTFENVVRGTALIAFAVGVVWIAIARRRLNASIRAASPEVVVDPTPDSPIPFGYKMTWLAVRSENSAAVVEALPLTSPTPANWQSGYRLIYQSRFDDPRVFVTPVVNGWVLVAGFAAGEPSDAGKQKQWNRLTRSLSKQFGDCQFFGNHRVSSYYAWSRWKDGELVRCFIYADSDIPANIGAETPEEAALPHRLPLDPSIPRPKRPPGEPAEPDIRDPGENDVMALAEKWSVNPLLLDELLTTPSAGTIGELTLK